METLARCISMICEMCKIIIIFQNTHLSLLTLKIAIYKFLWKGQSISKWFFSWENTVVLFTASSLLATFWPQTWIQLNFFPSFFGPWRGEEVMPSKIVCPFGWELSCRACVCVRPWRRSRRGYRIGTNTQQNSYWFGRSV